MNFFRWKITYPLKSCFEKSFMAASFLFGRRMKPERPPSAAVQAGWNQNDNSSNDQSHTAAPRLAVTHGSFEKIIKPSKKKKFFPHDFTCCLFRLCSKSSVRQKSLPVSIKISRMSFLSPFVKKTSISCFRDNIGYKSGHLLSLPLSGNKKSSIFYTNIPWFTGFSRLLQACRGKSGLWAAASF